MSTIKVVLPTGEKSEEVQSDDDRLFKPTWTCCYVCGRSTGRLLNQGPAVGMMCESCAEGFAIP